MRLYRFDLVQSFLTAGIPLSKIDWLRSFLEKYGHRLTSQSPKGADSLSSSKRKGNFKIRTVWSQSRFNHFWWQYTFGRGFSYHCAVCRQSMECPTKAGQTTSVSKKLKSWRASPVLDSSFGCGVCDPARCFVNCNEGRGHLWTRQRCSKLGSFSRSYLMLPASRIQLIT